MTIDGTATANPVNVISARRREVLFLMLLMLAACGGGGGGGASSGSSVVLNSIVISPTNPTLRAGTILQLGAAGNYSDGTSRDLSGSASWTSNATQVATVAPGGALSAMTSGSTTITATFNGLAASTSATVTAVQVTLTYLYTFQTVPTDGGQPNGPLLQANDGNFYGTTRAGGIYLCGPPPNNFYPCGTVFKLTPSGDETVLYSFGASPTDGYSPSQLIQGKDGALYGTTASGGANGGGTLFKIALDGVYTVLYSFGGSPSDGIVPASGVIQASDGDFYGVTASGGANHCVNIPQGGSNCGTVFKISPGGVETVLYSFGASISDGVEPAGSLIQASDGNFYGATENGGANACSTTGETHDCGTVFKITPAGIETVLHSFGTSVIDGIAPLGSLIQGTDGALYGTTSSGGGGTCGGVFGCGTVFRITPAGAVTILYAFSVTSRSDGNGPSPLIQGRDGNFYGTTGSGGAFPSDLNGTAFMLSPSGVITTLYSFGPYGTNPSHPVSALIEASDGAFYGLTNYSRVAVGNNGTAFKLVVQ